MTKNWLSIQREACELHANRYTLDEIKAALYDRHKFEASTRAWRTKFKEWGIKHRTANTSRIRKTTKSHSRKDQVPEKHATAEAPASISLDCPVLRYFKDAQVNEDTEYLDDLDREEKWNALAKEFVAHDYGDETTAIYYEHLGKYFGRCYYGLDLNRIRQAIDQVCKKAFWHIMRNRTKVLPALYGYLGNSDGLLYKNDIDDAFFEPCVERNEFCAHFTECLSVASAMLLHTKDQNVPGYWDTLCYVEQSAKLILRAWTAGDLCDPEKFFERYIYKVGNRNPSIIVGSILEVIPDEHLEIQIKAMQIVAAEYYQYDLFTSDLIMNPPALRATQTPLNWRLAEAILGYSGVKPVDYLNRLTDSFNRWRSRDQHVDVTKPSLSITKFLRIILEDCLNDHWLLKHCSNAVKHQVLSYFFHVITKAWLDLVLQDDAGSLELDASDILKIREDFDGLPELRLSVDAVALAQMAGSPYFKSLRPRLLGWGSEPTLGLSQDRTNDGGNEAAEAQVISSDEDEDEDEDMYDHQASSNADQNAHEAEDAQC